MRQEARIFLDLSAINFIDSTGLGALVGTLKKMGNEKFLGVIGAQKSVQAMFQLTRMNEIFRSFENIEAALASTNPS